MEEKKFTEVKKLFRDGKYAEAEEQLNAILKETPDDWQAKMLRDTCRLLQGTTTAVIASDKKTAMKFRRTGICFVCFVIAQIIMVFCPLEFYPLLILPAILTPLAVMSCKKIATPGYIEYTIIIYLIMMFIGACIIFFNNWTIPLAVQIILQLYLPWIMLHISCIYADIRLMRGDTETAKKIQAEIEAHYEETPDIPPEEKSFWQKYKKLILYTAGAVLVLAGTVVVAAAVFGGAIVDVFARLEPTMETYAPPPCPDCKHKWETYAMSAPPEGGRLEWQRCSHIHCHATRKVLKPGYGTCFKCGKYLSVHDMGFCRDCEKDREEMMEALTRHPGEDSLASIRRYGAYLAKKKGTSENVKPAPPCPDGKHVWAILHKSEDGTSYQFCRHCNETRDVLPPPCPDGKHEFWAVIVKRIEDSRYVSEETVYKCRHCGRRKENVDKDLKKGAPPPCPDSGHDWITWDISSDGVQSQYCRRCSKRRKLPDCPADKHEWETLYTIPLQNGKLEKQSCRRCHTTREVLPPPCAGDKHEWECFEDGKSGAVYRCRQCGSKQNKN